MNIFEQARANVETFNAKKEKNWEENKDNFVKGCITQIDKRILEWSKDGCLSCGFDTEDLCDVLGESPFNILDTQKISDVLVAVGKHYEEQGFKVNYRSHGFCSKDFPPYCRIYINWSEENERG